MAGVCDDLTVVELGAGSAAASMLGMELADAGARVVKVEPPEGDRLRDALPSAWLVWNRGKESLVADLRTDAGRAEARAALRCADVVVEAFAAGRAAAWGIGYDDLRATNPGLVYCTIKGFGSSGPYAPLQGYDGIVQAKAGMFGRGGFAFRPGPIFNGSFVASNGAAQMALGGILAALIVRDRTGVGQLVEASLFQGLNPCDYFLSYLTQLGQQAAAKAAAEGGAAAPVAQSASGSGATRYGVSGSTRDGRWLAFSPQLTHQARALMRVLGLEDLTADPRFARLPEFATAEDAAAWDEAVWERLYTRDYDDWIERGLADPDLPFDGVLSPEQALDHVQMRHNGLVQVVEDPTAGPVEQLGPTAELRGTPLRTVRSAPALGDHGDLVGVPDHPLGDAGHATVATPLPPHPLSGVTIVELGYFYAMPYGVTLAAALGARVIKIEDLGGDPMRYSFGPPEWGSAHVMEGKESISLDLRQPEGQEILRELVQRADVFVQGFRPGVGERLHADYDSLREINPDLVYVHAAGYGTSGPYAHRPIYAGVAGALCGSVHRQAGYWLESGLSKELSALEAQAVIGPRMNGITDGDANAALGVFTAIMLGLRHQRRTGQGQHVSTSMLGGNAMCYSDEFNRYAAKPPSPMADPEQFGFNSCYRLYPAAEGWVFFAAPTGRALRNALDAAGRADILADPRFSSAETRRAHDDELIGVLGELFRTRPATDWEKLMTDAGVGCVAANEAGQAAVTCSDPALRQMGLVVEVEHPSFGPLLRYAPPAALSATPGDVRPGCVFAQHSAALLAELGYGDDQIADLSARGVVKLAG